MVMSDSAGNDAGFAPPLGRGLLNKASGGLHSPHP
jgi:hypothetical protein